MDFELEYNKAVTGEYGKDMFEHLPWLSEKVSECTHVTEFGVGRGESTRALLRHDVEIHSYEFMPINNIEQLFEDAIKHGRRITLHVVDITKIVIAPTDLLVVDSYHSYDQVKTELELHADKVRKYIFFHDTTLYADRGQGGENGIWPAIDEFLQSHTEWQLVERRTNNNGMTLIKRVQ